MTGQSTARRRQEGGQFDLIGVGRIDRECRRHARSRQPAEKPEIRRDAVAAILYHINQYFMGLLGLFETFVDLCIVLWFGGRTVGNLILIHHCLLGRNGDHLLDFLGAGD
jgi:hypothetical protein